MLNDENFRSHTSLYISLQQISHLNDSKGRWSSTWEEMLRTNIHKKSIQCMFLLFSALSFTTNRKMLLDKDVTCNLSKHVVIFFWWNYWTQVQKEKKEFHFDSACWNRVRSEPTQRAETQGLIPGWFHYFTNNKSHSTISNITFVVKHYRFVCFFAVKAPDWFAKYSNEMQS